MEWVCQHSCAAESIPDCQDFNCEGTLIVDRGQLEDVRELVARGQLAAFDGVQVQLKLDVPGRVGAELQRFAHGRLYDATISWVWSVVGNWPRHVPGPHR